MRHVSPLKRTDRSCNHYVYLLWQELSGLHLHDGLPREQYVCRGASLKKLVDVIADAQAGIVCLNDNEQIDDWRERAAVVRQEIRKKIGITE